MRESLEEVSLEGVMGAMLGTAMALMKVLGVFLLKVREDMPTMLLVM